MSTLPSPPPTGPDSPSWSKLLPVVPGRLNLFRSRILLPIAALSIGALILLSDWAYEDLNRFYTIVGALLLLSMFYMVYIYSGERLSSARYWLVYFATYFQCKVIYWPVYRPIFESLKLTAEDVVPGSFLTTFWNYFISAGIAEEVLKGLPALICLVIALSQPRDGSRPQSWLALRGPLDGLLMGFAAAAAFTMWETVEGYVLIASRRANDEMVGLAYGVLTLLRRTLSSFDGHVGYAGIFGYFIGLAVLYPRRAARIVGFGLLISALLHGFWDAIIPFASPEVGLAGPGVIATLLFVGCLLKARQLEAPRLRAAGPSDSILVDSLPIGGAPFAAPALREPTPVAGALVGAIGGLERSIGLDAKPEPVKAARIVPPHGLSIGAAHARYVIEAGRRIDLAGLFASRGAPAGSAAMARDLGESACRLGNVGTGIWYLTGPDGSAGTLPPGAETWVIPGSRLKVGSAELEITAY